MSHIPASQVLWLLLYWAGLGPALFLLTLGMIRGADFQNLATLAIALFAGVLGAIWATRIARAHVDAVAFAKGTTTIRAIAVAWLAIGAFLVVAPVVSVLLGADVGDTGEALGFISTVGSVSLLAVLGPGYAEYREALAAAGSGPRFQPVTAAD